VKWKWPEARREVPAQPPAGNVDINLASLIDVVFVLLLFFVVTTTFTRETQLRVELPEAASGAGRPGQAGGNRHQRRRRVFGEQPPAAQERPGHPEEAIEKESGGDTKLPLAISADGKTRTRL
jgi:biopolymer transport protein ExbD